MESIKYLSWILFLPIILVKAGRPILGQIDAPYKNYTLSVMPLYFRAQNMSNFNESESQEIVTHPSTTKAKKQDNAEAAANRFTHATTTKKRIKRTTPIRASFEEECDYLAKYCMKAYVTGKLCARTIYYQYHTFANYCMLDYVNCMERYELWQVVHMGVCFEIKPLTEYLHYPYQDDFFLDQYYVVEDS